MKLRPRSGAGGQIVSAILANTKSKFNHRQAGRFKLDDLVAGSGWVLTVDSAGYVRQTTKPVSAGRIAAAEPVEIQLDPVDPASLVTYTGPFLSRAKCQRPPAPDFPARGCAACTPSAVNRLVPAPGGSSERVMYCGNLNVEKSLRFGFWYLTMASCSDCPSFNCRIGGALSLTETDSQIVFPPSTIFSRQICSVTVAVFFFPEAEALIRDPLSSSSRFRFGLHHDRTRAGGWLVPRDCNSFSSDCFNCCCSSGVPSTLTFSVTAAWTPASNGFSSSACDGLSPASL